MQIIFTSFFNDSLYSPSIALVLLGFLPVKLSLFLVLSIFLNACVWLLRKFQKENEKFVLRYEVCFVLDDEIASSFLEQRFRASAGFFLLSSQSWKIWISTYRNLLIFVFICWLRMLTLIYSFPVISKRIESVKFSWCASSSVVSLLVNCFILSSSFILQLPVPFDCEEAI